MKPTLTIAIPAFNEYANLRYIIPQLLIQKRQNYRLSNILIVSDGSTDLTGTLTDRYTSQCIHFIHEQKRLGKPWRINQIFASVISDIVVILDADIKFSSLDVIDTLLSDMPKSHHFLISGHTIPLQPNTFIQKVSYAGIQIWNSARNIARNTQMYYADGSIRAFSKSLYKQIHFPDSSADDAYSYIFCVTHKGKFLFQPKAVVYNRLPSTIIDYYKQQRRYLISPIIQRHHFSRINVNKYFTITPIYKLKALILNIFYNPVYTILYVFFISCIKIDLLVEPENYTSMWSMLKSTKTANI